MVIKRSLGDGVGRVDREALPVTVMRRCGHEDVIRIYGDPSKSRYYAAQELLDCSKCRNAVWVDEDSAAVASGRRVPLEGSAKQVPWAQVIRSQRAEGFAAYMAGVRAIGQKLFIARRLDADAREAGLTAVREAIRDLMQGNLDFNPDEYGQHSGHARWWIDSKDLTPRAILGLIVPDRDVMGGLFGGGEDDHSGVFVTVDPNPAPNTAGPPLVAVAEAPATTRATNAIAAHAAMLRADLLDLDDAPF